MKASEAIQESQFPVGFLRSLHTGQKIVGKLPHYFKGSQFPVGFLRSLHWVATCVNMLVNSVGVSIPCRVSKVTPPLVLRGILAGLLRGSQFPVGFLRSLHKPKRPSNKVIIEALSQFPVGFLRSLHTPRTSVTSA